MTFSTTSFHMQGSSRSHCVFMVTVASSVPTEEGESMPRVGKLNLVDLAGSERAGKTGAQAGSDRFQEGVMINASLSALGNVIRQVAPAAGLHVTLCHRWRALRQCCSF